jgi:hypothetical protein
MNLRKTQRVVLGAALGLLMVATPSALRATPYASGITNDSGTVSFILNEPADNVKIIFDGGGVGNTNDLGALPKGVASFSLGSHTSWAIHVTKSTALAWTQISADTNVYNQFYQPRSTAVNRNPASPAFGRVYVLENGNSSLGGSTGTGRVINKGIYAMNGDLSDALGQGNTGLKGGLDTIVGENGTSYFLSVNSAYDPWKLVVGEDDYLYIPNANNPLGSLARVDANLANGELVLAGVGNTIRSDLHTVVYGVKVTGSLGAGTLSVLGIDGQWPAAANTVMRWDVGSGNAGTLPAETVPTQLFVATTGGATEQDSDLDVHTNGNIFVHIYRSTVNGPTPSLQVFSPTGTQLYTSVNGSADAFLASRSIKISPDGSKLAIFRANRQTVILGLTNGVPDLSSSNQVATFTQTGAITSRSVDWDAAGNLYVANNGNELLRVFSPGGSKTAITKSDGTFELVAPSTVVNVTASTPMANEAGPVNGGFTLTRTGDLGLPLTVNYTMSGTAGSGSDYTALLGSVTFQAGAVSTNITVAVSDDSDVEFTETVILTIDGSLNYGIGSGSATVNVLDNEAATVSIAPTTAETRLLEGYSAQKLGFTLTRQGLISSALTVNIGYSGAATLGADFNGPATVAVAPNAATATFAVTPFDDDTYEGAETFDITITPDPSYVPGTPAVGNVTLIDDDYPAGTVIFADNFDTDSSTLWSVNAFDGLANSSATFAEDYSVTSYVPPSKPSGTTKGLVFRANLVASLARNAISASPLGLNLSGDYRLRFKAWNNYNGPLAGGGAGSTYHLTGGVGTTGDHAQFAFGSADGIWFDMGGDGQSTQVIGDTSAYAGPQVLTAEYGVYAAPGTVDTVDRPRSATNPYYSIWGGIQAPAAQVTAYSVQAGTSDVGSFGVSWHTVVIGHETNTVYWVIDGILLATVPDSFAPLGPNVFVGWADNFNNSVTSFPNPAAMSFGIIDDLRVETIAATPITITGIQIVGGNVEVTFTGPAANVAADFKLQSAGTVNGTYTDDNSATPSNIGSGSFKFTTALSGSSSFYMIKL